MNEAEKERLIKKDIAMIENKVRHAFNQGYEMGLKENKSEIPTSCGDAISREAVLDIITFEDKWLFDAKSHNKDTEIAFLAMKSKISEMPSVTPQQKTEQQRTGRWIPVSERLPEDDEVILFSTKTDRVCNGRYFDDDTDFQWYAFRDEIFVENNVVTAWMPLPQPYEAESEEKK